MQTHLRIAIPSRFKPIVPTTARMECACKNGDADLNRARGMGDSSMRSVFVSARQLLGAEDLSGRREALVSQASLCAGNLSTVDELPDPGGRCVLFWPGCLAGRTG